MKQIILLLVIFHPIISSAQKPMIINGSDVEIMNPLAGAISFRVSFDKQHWSIDSVKRNAQITRTIPNQFEIFYLELCQDDSSQSITICDTFKLKPKNRYVIDFDNNQTKLVIRNSIPN